MDFPLLTIMNINLKKRYIKVYWVDDVLGQ